ncbi:MAG: hypothetical protein QF393_12205 [Rhodospirillales bacterium]|jgi:hypothetical protein|nr:hypothetical protein [Rhodospirillales bacterium]MDP6643268.1 hypothetical protein [Rhodospirillales bacterium]|tara:strand:- start:272 stop:442 length:171 start_codon:yes stop_codon:yes gene_type:complete
MNKQNTDAAARLEEMLLTARALAAGSDPLLAGQYTLLVGQIEALLAIIRPDAGAES